MTTDAPSRKPIRAFFKENWHRLNRRDKHECAALMVAYLDKQDGRLSHKERAEFDQVRPRRGKADPDKLSVWLTSHGYLTAAGELGERALVRMPATRAAAEGLN